jgi:hypothetical protein
VGSLVFVATHNLIQKDMILFCEPDMLFVRNLTPKSGLSGEQYGYLDYTEPRIMNALEQAGFEKSDAVLSRCQTIGVPYWIPRSLLKRLSIAWLEVLDGMDEPRWIDIMYAWGIALQLEGETAEVTREMEENDYDDRKLGRDLIHYCHGSDLWNKRKFIYKSPFSAAPHPILGAPGTVLREVTMQINEAACHFR